MGDECQTLIVAEQPIRETSVEDAVWERVS